MKFNKLVLPVIVASAVLAGVVFLSGCAVIDKLDRGAYNVHQAVTQEDTVTGERVIGGISREKQIAKGNANMQKIIADYSLLNARVDSHTYARLQRIFNRVHQVSHFANENWDVILIPEDSFNAFVTGGTMIAVHHGLMDLDDEGVAAVLGHEMGHVAASHAFEGTSRALFQLLDKGRSGEGLGFAYGTLQEEEADQIGVMYAALAGYNPTAISAVWQEFARDGDNWSWFRSHPADSDRARATKILGDRVRQYYSAGRINPNHAELSRCNVLWCNR